MWICLNNAFLSIVRKDCGPDELCVRARRKGDIERIWPEAKVTKYTKSDYLYRAILPVSEVRWAISKLLAAIDYPNFKDSVEDELLHDCYLDVWQTMTKVQELPPYSGVTKKGEKNAV